MKELRGSASQAFTARQFGIAQQTYAGWENNKSRPDITELRGIAEFYNVSADWLLGLTDDPTPARSRKTSSTVTVNGHGNAVGHGNTVTQSTLESRVAELERRLAGGGADDAFNRSFCEPLYVALRSLIKPGLVDDAAWWDVLRSLSAVAPGEVPRDCRESYGKIFPRKHRLQSFDSRIAAMTPDDKSELADAVLSMAYAMMR